MSAAQNDWLDVRPETLTQNGFTYETFRLVGVVAGKRVRLQFKDRAAAEVEKRRREVEAANEAGSVRTE